jgi:hypothetical protein
MYDRQSSTSASLADRRRDGRAILNLQVRFLLQDGSENAGVVDDISVGGMNIVTKARADEGSIIIAYVEDLGRLEGVVSRVDDRGIAVRLVLSAMRREKLQERLGIPGADPAKARNVDGRRFSRESGEGATLIRRADGTQLTGRVIDLSLGGVAVEAAEWPPLGEQVIVGKMRGRVVRHAENGFAVEFTEMPPSRGSLAEQLSARGEQAA